MSTAITLRFRSSDGHHAHYDAVIDRQLVERAIVVQCGTGRVSFGYTDRFSSDTQRALLRALLASGRAQRRAVHSRFLAPAASPVDRGVGMEVLGAAINSARKMIRANLAVLGG